jgi:hypothetical protein
MSRTVRTETGTQDGNGDEDGNGDAARFDHLPRPARQRRWSGRAEGLLGPEFMPRAWTNAG